MPDCDTPHFDDIAELCGATDICRELELLEAFCHNQYACQGGDLVTIINRDRALK
jgi:hypothetical protein